MILTEMSKFLIEGGKPLNGEIEVMGAKNAALKIIAATILAKGKYEIKNVPKINDIKVLLQILKYLKVKIEFTDHDLLVDTTNLENKPLPTSLTGKLRGAIVLIGPLLTRFGKTEIAEPGGCQIGARPIDTHLNAFAQLGAEIVKSGDCYTFKLDKINDNRIIVLSEMSVTGTENIILASVLKPGKTEVHIAAAEPEIEDLVNFLKKMGAKIEGAGTNKIKIEGVSELKSTDYEIMPDRIEAGTLIIAAIITKGCVTVKKIIPEHLELFFLKLKTMGANFEVAYTYPDKKYADILIEPTENLSSIKKLDIRPYPGFPTDLQAPMAVLMTQAEGKSEIFETMFENRLGYIRELQKMGAKASIKSKYSAHIAGPTPLFGKKITTLDLRAGATLILAALIAKGKTTINKAEIIDRGYEKIEKRLAKLGAEIKRI